MKNFKLLALLVLLVGTVNAQTSQNPWLVSVGVNAVGLQGDLTGSNPLLKSDYKSMSFGVPSLSVFRSIYGGFSIGAQFSLNSLKSETSVSDTSFSSIEGALKYGFSRDSKVSPFLKAGFGRTSFGVGDEDEFNEARNATDTYFGSAGLNFKVGDRLSLFVESSYRSTQDAPKGSYLQHTFGVAFGLGSGDTDKDGVSDKKDKCPDVPGLKEFEGCPDTDADGIPDDQDNCPEEAGPEENNGCPDTDGDGVLDKDDACVDVAGLAELNGCPDSDEDGVIDSEDECPQEAGETENNGCPWPDQDNDGIADKDDACPDEAGTTEGNGCPDTSKEVLSEMNSVGSNILFPANGFKLMGKKTLDAIKEVKRILDENPTASILIEGHASTDGGEKINQEISLKRAESVKAKLIELGVDESRLEVKAFGESMPVLGEDSIETRSKSRRVEFKSKS
ncbi:MAG: cell envelope biogenesis protein OmpA [Flavobacteriales bacterium]|jgi:outer membrane protein OmpA-like peptidoglycan-associated protein|nr:cell envelope biogenesis protein OmpA [Candidatus Arcticimaribacter sp.]|tara:strand:- start:392 stop:1738 length:1347 start_codon:yes stop_codon:yes gene_type:complete